MKLYYISNNKFTCGVVADDNGKVIETAYILGKFKGQQISQLARWCKKNNSEIKEIKEPI